MNETTTRTYGWLRTGALLAILALLAPFAFAQSTDELTNPDPEDWPTYGRTLDMWRFSPLDQINRDNVGDLRIAWARSLEFTNDAQLSPAVYDGVMYINLPDGVAALDATNGDVIWETTFELDENTASLTGDRSRGSVVVYDGKIFHSIADGRVVGLDAATGDELWSTQVGMIDVGEGFSSGPIFADGKIIVGPSGADIGGAPGRVISMDAESGEVLWTFNTVPRPGEAGFETWNPPSAAEWGGGSAWTPGAYDPETRTVIYGVGQPIPWWSGDQRSGDSLYTASYVALDVDTGELKWYHQVVPNDEWDYDQIATPTFLDMEFDGEMRRVALLPTTSGFLVLMDAGTGEFLDWHTGFTPEEGSVHKGYEDDGTPIIDDSMRYETPGEVKLVCPLRWVDWEPSAYSPETGLYYRPNSWMCTNIGNSPRPDDWEPGQNPLDVTFEFLFDRFDRLGALSAIDPATGEVVWEFTTGYTNFTGPVATAGDLVFSGFADRVFRAFDAESGEILFEQVLPASVTAHTMTYMVDGVQYVAVPAGGSGQIIVGRQSDVPPIVSSDVTLFVFALPQQ